MITDKTFFGLFGLEAVTQRNFASTSFDTTAMPVVVLERCRSAHLSFLLQKESCGMFVSSTVLYNMAAIPDGYWPITGFVI